MDEIFYGYKEEVFVLPQDDCFFKMKTALENDEQIKNLNGNICIVHSRFAEVKRYYQVKSLQGDVGLGAIPINHAHPNIDYKQRIALFHNGSIANYDELLKEAKDLKFNLGTDQLS